MQRSRLPGGDQRGGAQGAAGLPVAANRNAIARHHEAVPRRDGAAVGRERRGTDSERRGDLDEGDVRGDAMAQHRVHVEIGVPRDSAEVLEHGLARSVELDQLVARARQHAMRRGEHDILRDQRA